MQAYRALLMTDIVDSTRISQEIGNAETQRLWAVHDEMARALLRTWNGREIEKTDGLVAVFGGAAEALGYAIDYRRGLISTGFPLEARVAIEVGQLTVRECSPDDLAVGATRFAVDGLAKPVVARLLAIARGHQILLTADAVMALGYSEFRVQTHGHWRLKGLDRPIEIFEIGERNAHFAAPRDDVKAYRVVRVHDLWLPARDIPHSLPAARDAFVGRDESLKQIADKFENGARLLSVVGVGGTGKTRLVLRYAWMSLGDRPGGSWFCDLAQARTIDGIYFAVAQGLGLSLNNADPAMQIARALAGRGTCLVILDNFEQVAELAEQTLGLWMDHAPLATFMATTRETLRIVGEEVLSLATLSDDDGTALFLRRAESTRQDYCPSPADLAAIRALVQRLDGLPLALELAAARIRVLPPQALLSRLHERFDLLAAPARRLGRQATLRAAFDWSWQLLSDAEKSAMAQLSTFEGGFTLQTAAAVLAPVRAGPARDEDMVESLLSKSFVQQVDDRRFRLLESVRAYAQEHLDTAGSFAGSGPQAAVEAQRRHWTYFSTLGESANENGQCDEANNLVAACRRATQAGETGAAVGCLIGAWTILRLTGPLRVGAELAEKLLANAALGDGERALAHWVAGNALELMGVVNPARQHFIDGLRLARSSGDAVCEARLLMALGNRQTIDGDLQAAYQNLADAEQRATANANTSLQAQILNCIGRLMDHQSRFHEARMAYEKALVLARQMGDRRLEGGLLGNLGGLHLDQGHLKAAREQYDQALALAREVGDRRWEGNIQCNLGLISQEEGLLEDARVRFERALQVAREIGHASLEYTVLCNLGIVLEAEGLVEEATSNYEQAVAAARDAADPRSEGQFQGYLAVVYAKLGRADEAQACLSKGERMLLDMGDQLAYAVLNCQRADIEFMAQRHEGARAACAIAEKIAVRLEAGLESELGRRLAALQTLLGAEHRAIGG